jgi:hypothetical protein
METLTNLAYFGIPVVGVLSLGVLWLVRSVFKDVSLNEVHDGDRRTVKAERLAESLDLQLAVAEDLGIDAPTLNHLKDQADLAHEDAERARETQERRQPAPAPAVAPWFSPVAAVHSLPTSKKKNNNKKKDGSSN